MLIKYNCFKYFIFQYTLDQNFLFEPERNSLQEPFFNEDREN